MATGDKMTNYKAYKNRPEGDKDYKRPHSEEALMDVPDSFISKWGMLAVTLAKEEGVHCATIHMRVKNYGTPFQRKGKPTKCEELYHKTEGELALAINIHPQSIRQRVRKHNNAYYVNPAKVGNPNAGAIYSDNDWRDWPKVKNSVFWLHPLHPDYPVERGDKR